MYPTNHDGDRKRPYVKGGSHKLHLLSEMIASHFYRCLGALCPFSDDPDRSGLAVILDFAQFSVKRMHAGAVNMAKKVLAICRSIWYYF